MNLVSPIDNYFQIRKSGNIKPSGVFDHLIMSMGIHLAHIHGPENVCILTAGNRLADLVNKCKGNRPANTLRRLKLNIAESITGKNSAKKSFHVT